MKIKRFYSDKEAMKSEFYFVRDLERVTANVNFRFQLVPDSQTSIITTQPPSTSIIDRQLFIIFFGLGDISKQKFQVVFLEIFLERLDFVLAISFDS
jgi:hypothetical protein